MSIYRVLLEDEVNGEKFRFAPYVTGELNISSEIRAQNGMSDEACRYASAITKALNEFPGSVLVEARLIVDDREIF